MEHLAAFICRHSRVRCVDCGRTLLRGERGWSPFEIAAHHRPHSPVWCQGCKAKIVSPQTAGQEDGE